MPVKLKPNDNPLTPVRPVNNLAYIFYYFQGIKPKLLTKLKAKGSKNPEKTFIGLRNLVARDLLKGKLRSGSINEANLAQRVTQLCANRKLLEAKISRLNMDQLIPKDKVVDTIDRDADQLTITARHRDQLVDIFKAPTLLQGTASTHDGHADTNQSLALLRLLERRKFIEAFDFPLHRVPQRLKEAADRKWPADVGRERTAGELELLGFSRDDISKAMGITKRTLSNLLINFRNSFLLPADRFIYRSELEANKHEQEIKFLRTRKRFLEAERQEKLIGLDASSIFRDRLLAYLFHTDELHGNESILKKHKLTEDELFKIVLNLIEMLGQGAYYASMGVLKEHVQGYSSNAIADKFKITASTVNRDLIMARKVLREYLDKYFNNKPPKVKGLEIDRFAWIKMDENYQRTLKLYLEGKSTKEIASTVYGGEHEISAVLYRIREHFGWTLEEFIKAATASRCDKFKAIKVDSPTYRNNVLKMVYPEAMPQTLAVANQASWEKKIYQQVIALAQQDEINSGALEQFQLRAKGIPYHEIESLIGVEDSSQEVHRMVAKIRTRLDHEVIAPYLFDYADRVQPNGVQTQLPDAACVFAKNLNYKEGGLYVYPSLRGILPADIARSYGKNLTDVQPVLEAGLTKVRTRQSDYDHVGAMFAGVTIDPAKFNDLTEQEMSALKVLSPAYPLRRAIAKIGLKPDSLRAAFAHMEQMRGLAKGKPELLSLAVWLRLKPIEKAVACEFYDKGLLHASDVYRNIRNLFPAHTNKSQAEEEIQSILNRFI